MNEKATEAIEQDERRYTKHEVSQLISGRVNKLNEKIARLELDLAIYQLEERLSGYDDE